MRETKQTSGESMSRKEYMLKRNGKPVDSTEQNGASNEPLEFRENDRINAQIDGYIKENSRHWNLIKSMPRERLERTVVWQQLRFNSRKEKMDNGLLRKVEENPELKRDYENLRKTCSRGSAGKSQGQHRPNPCPIAIEGRTTGNKTRSRRLKSGVPERLHGF